MLAIAVAMGFLMDLWLGDPENWWHPVRGMGWLIGRMETGLRSVFPKTPRGELAAGGVLALSVPAMVAGAAAVLLLAAQKVHPMAHLAVMGVMSWQALAAKSLMAESRNVYDALKKGEVEEARKAVSRIVGRDTQKLSEEGIIKAAVETVAENASDGVVAPMVYLMLFGPVGGFAYKAVNTMDSMVGYQNGQYEYFGRAAAKLDDLANLLPSRLTALFMVGVAWLLPGFDGPGAFFIWRRDRRCHKSPNSAQGESACAGALGVQLAGDAWYFGKLCPKPTIGDGKRPVEAEDILRANCLMCGSAVLALAAGVAGLLVL